MRFLIYALIALCLSGPATADFYEPARGTSERKAMLDALRAHAEEQLGDPVEFVVYDLRISGKMGFAAVYAQRPGGGEIDLYSTPGYSEGALDPDSMDGTSMQALLRLSGETWVAVHWAIGPTDVWFAYGPFCRRYRAVISDYCEGVN
ncbi:hypothetical protein [Planktotalea sp.]|uniref:hypothetical protein n=1 Tax=Planktotalea sp. TaxID=2029877 RepID=UPI003298D968